MKRIILILNALLIQAITFSQITYTFNGNGNWSDSSQWLNNLTPPNTLINSTTIIIDPIINGKAILDVDLLISPGSSLIVMENKDFQINGNLTIHQPPSTKVKTYIEDVRNGAYHNTDTFNIMYDSSDKITSLISNFSGGKFLYTYNGDTSYTLEIISGSNLIIKEIFFINSDLLIDSTFQYNNTADSMTERMIYNSNKQLIQQFSYDYSLPKGSSLWKREDHVYDTNSNLYKTFEIKPSGDTSLITTYTYNNIISNFFALSPYRGILSKNQPVSISYYYPSSHSTRSVAITYTYDSDNRVSTETQKDNSGNVVVKTFLYY